MSDRIDILIASRFDARGTAEAQKAVAALAGSTAPLTQAQAQQARASQQAAQAQTQLATVSQRLATEQQKTAAASGRAAVEAQRLATEQARTATANAQAAAAHARADQAALRLAQSQNQASQSAQRQANEALRLAQAQAALARAEGDSARAVTILSTALQNNTAASERATLATQAQVARLQSGASGMQQFGQAVNQVAGQIGGITGQIGQLATSLGTIGAVGAAIGVAKAGFDLAQLGASADAARGSFDSLAQSADVDGRQLLTSLRAASQGTVTDAQLIASANRAILLVGSNMAQELPRLLQIARAAAKSTGDDVGFVFESLVKGIARGSPQIIDNANITLNATEAFDKYAASIGKTADQLTKQEQQQATLNAVLAAGGDIIAKTGGAVEDNATKLARLGVIAENVKASIGSSIADAIVPTVDTFSALTQVTDGSRESLLRYVDAANTYIGASAGTAAVNHQAAESLANFLGLASSAPPTISAEAQAQQAATAAAQAHAAQLQATSTAISNNTVLITDQNGQLVQMAEVTQAAVQQSLLDSEAKNLQAQQTQVLQEQTRLAVDTFMELHPNISASGVASMVMAGQLNPLIGQLVVVRIRAQEAQAALLAVANAQNAASVRATVERNRATGGGLSSGEQAERQAAFARATQEHNKAVAAGVEQTNARLEAQAAAYKKVRDAQEQQALTTGTVAQQQAVLNARLERARVTYGEQSAEFTNAQTALIQFQQQQDKATTKGARGGGGRARADAATKAGEQLAKIEQQTGDKLAAIDAATQDKLVALDQKAAEQRAQAAYKLASDIATSQADLLAQQEADDLDLIGAKEDQIGKLQAREQAQLKSRQATLEAQRQAQEQAAAGDAETAQKVLDVRERSIAAQEKIDQQYYEKQQELAGDDAALAALKQQYDEATAANQAAADTRIMLAQQEAQQKAQAAQQERDQIIASAEEQKAQVLGKAVEQAQGVSKASADQRAAVVANLNAQAEAVRSWASSVESASARVVDSAEDAKAALSSIPGPASVGNAPASSGSTSAPVGGSSSGPAGGAQIARGGAGAQISGRGALGAAATASSPADVLASLQSLNQVLDQLLKLANQYGKYAAPLEKYKASIGVAIETLNATFELSQNLGSPAPPISMAAVQALLAEGQQVVALFLAGLLPTTKQQVEASERYGQLSEASIAPLKEMVDLRQSFAEPAPALTGAMAQKLVAEVVGVTYLMQQVLVPTTEQQASEAERWQRASEALIGPIKSVIDVRQGLTEPAPVLTRTVVEKLVAEVVGVAYLMRQGLLPTTEQQAADAERFQRASEATISPINAVLEVRKGLVEPAPALARPVVEKLIAEVVGVTYLMRSILLPTTEEQAAEAERWQRASEANIAPLSAVLDLRKGLAEPAPALDLAQIQTLAGETVRVNQVMQDVLLPVTEEQSEAAQRWADATQASVAALKAPLELSGKLFADYVSPSDAQINLVAQDSLRVVRGVADAATILSTEGLEAAKAFGEANGAIISSFKEELLFVQALNSGDFTGIQQGALDTFKRDSLAIIDVARMLGEQAATVPTAGLNALGTVTGAISGVADMWLKLASVPFGNLGDIATATGGIGVGGGGGVTIMPGAIVINQLPGQDAQQLANYVISQVNQRIGARR